jgi:GNAT superfamily N-acetyltransferase
MAYFAGRPSRSATSYFVVGDLVLRVRDATISLASSRATRGTWPDDGPASGFGAVPMPGSMKEESMGRVQALQFRPAGPDDAEAVANLHADSWRRHYRGAYSDAFLDGDVFADRLAVWTERLREPDPRRCTILAENGSLVGFANTIFDDDPRWGALLENLHVADRHKRRGIGARLLALTAEDLIECSEWTGLYLWVLQQNVDGQAFYQACGGRCVGQGPVSPPGGIAGRLAGSPVKLRYAWAEPMVLLGQR